MKKKALATKMAAFVMAGAMTMAMGFPAMADVNLNNETTLTKEVPVPNNMTFAPATSFTFTITPDTDPSNKTYLKAAIPGGLYFEDSTETNRNKISMDFAELNNGETPAVTNGKYSLSKKMKVSSVLFENAEPGVYHYQVSESASGYQGITNDPNLTRDVYVHIMYDADGNRQAYITSAIPTLDDTTGVEKTAEIKFVNEYGKDNTVKRLEVDKLLDGSFASANDEFKVKVKVQQDDNVPTGSDENYLVKVFDEANTEKSTLKLTNNAESNEITIKGGYKIFVYGLSAGDKFSIVETDRLDYTDSYVNISKLVDTNYDTTNHTFTGKIEATEGESKVTLKNTRNAATPTGIVTEYAPYILLVAAAGAFAVLFLRRKKEEF